MENWSDHRLVPKGVVRRVCEDRGRRFIELTRGDYSYFPFFTKILVGVDIPDPEIYILSLRPVTPTDDQEMSCWMDFNDVILETQLSNTTKRQFDTNRRYDFYGDALANLINLRFRAPLRTEDIKDFKSVSDMHTLLEGKIGHKERL